MTQQTVEQHDSPPDDADQRAADSDRQTSPLRSVHTDSMAELLRQAGVTVAATTYQAGFVILNRYDGSSLNTHFRTCARPMGMAAAGSRLAIGAAREVLQYRNMADAATRLTGSQPHDACYLPRGSHVTGDIDIHEMAWGDEAQRAAGEGPAGGDDPPSLPPDSCPPTPELWIVNTRFSCLATVSDDHSFVPRWRPPFISSLSPQGRCHLNGLALMDGRPRYVTALGETDWPQGWRPGKATGGVLIDVDSNETIARGLSMPHSPRWHDGRLWLLESGDGSIGHVDFDTGRYEAVARVDGFTRGLDFIGPYALIGISQVRESALFSGIPITERLAPDRRICGISVVDLRSGSEVGFVHFEDRVQEIFAVQVLPYRFPELVEATDDLLATSYALPDEALADVGWVEGEGGGRKAEG